MKDYLDYLEVEKNHSPRTRANYERYLARFLKEEGVRTLTGLTMGAITSFRKKLNRSEIKKSTQSYYLIALRNFLRFLAKQDIKSIAPEKIELPRLPPRQIEILEPADLERLLEAPAGDDIRSLRDRAILELLFSTGLRLSELCNLSRYLPFDRREFTVRGKGEKLRVVFVSDAAAAALKRYQGKRTDTLEYLFVSLTKQGKTIGKITPRAVERLVDHYCRKAGLTKRISPHGLRHLFATDLLRNGADLRSVQELLGHSNVSTTQIYTHVTNRELRDVHQRFHGKER